MKSFKQYLINEESETPAKKDYDGDGVIEPGSKEWKDSRDNAIKQSIAERDRGDYAALEKRFAEISDADLTRLLPGPVKKFGISGVRKNLGQFVDNTGKPRTAAAAMAQHFKSGEGGKSLGKILDPVKADRARPQED